MISKRVTLLEALEAWGTDSTRGTADQDAHMPLETLYELLIHPPEPHQRDAILDHLSRCPVCLGELKQMAAGIEDVDRWNFETHDAAYLRAAASAESADAFQSPQRITTDGGKYVIDIRRYLAKENRGLITLKVAEPYRASLEGKTVYVTDDAGHLLLKGQIHDGEVSKDLENLDQIANKLSVRAE